VLLATIEPVGTVVLADWSPGVRVAVLRELR
jgi:hypothetical protein